MIPIVFGRELPNIRSLCSVATTGAREEEGLWSRLVVEHGVSHHGGGDLDVGGEELLRNMVHIVAVARERSARTRNLRHAARWPGHPGDSSTEISMNNRRIRPL